MEGSISRPASGRHRQREDEDVTFHTPQATRCADEDTTMNEQQEAQQDVQQQNVQPRVVLLPVEALSTRTKEQDQRAATPTPATETATMITGTAGTRNKEGQRSSCGDYEDTVAEGVAARGRCRPRGSTTSKPGAFHVAPYRGRRRSACIGWSSTSGSLRRSSDVGHDRYDDINDDDENSEDTDVRGTTAPVWTQPLPGDHQLQQQEPTSSVDDRECQDDDDESNNTVSCSQQDRSIAVVVTTAEAVDEEAEFERRQEDFRAGHEAGRQEALQALRSVAIAGEAKLVQTVVVVDPVVPPEDNSKATWWWWPLHHAVLRRMLHVIVLVVLLAVATTVPVLLLVKGNNHQASPRPLRGSSSTGVPSSPNGFDCFVDPAELRKAVDKYLSPSSWDVGRNPPNYATKYGPRIEDWCVAGIGQFDSLFSAQRNPNAAAFDADLGNWDISHALTTRYMFRKAYRFRGLGLDKWNVSQVTDMTSMFEGAYSFNADLTLWDVSQTVSMNSLFRHTSSFQGQGVDRWNVALVQDMNNMFFGASSFDDKLAAWDVSRVPSMHAMFYNAYSFHGDGLETWDVSQVQDMAGMFYGASSFRADLRTWDVSRVTDMSGMFENTNSFRGEGLETWNVSQAKDMTEMFAYTMNFSADLSSWDVSQVTCMDHIFSRSSSFNRSLCSWGDRLMKTVSLFETFEGTTCPFTSPPVLLGSGTPGGPFCHQCLLGGTNSPSAASAIGSITGYTSAAPHKCFETTRELMAAVDNYLIAAGRDVNTAQTYGYPIGRWCVSKIRVFDSLLSADRNPSAATFDADLAGWDTSSAVSMKGIFGGAGSFRGTGLDQWDVSQVQDMSGMFALASSFDADLSGWDVSNVVMMTEMFRYARSYRGIGLDAWNVSQARDFFGMFADALSFDADLAGWNVSSAVSLTGMFYNAKGFHGAGLERWKVAQVTDFQYMFDGASAFDGLLAGWDVSQGSAFKGMFSDAHHFRGVGLGAWNVSNAVSMDYMFRNAYSFRGVDLQTWDVSRVEDMSFMFFGTSELSANLSTWDVRRVHSMRSMFDSATAFNTSLCSWARRISTDVDTEFMFERTSCPLARSHVWVASPPTPLCHECR